jgi:hypothetical protein
MKSFIQKVKNYYVKVMMNLISKELAKPAKIFWVPLPASILNKYTAVVISTVIGDNVNIAYVANLTAYRVVDSFISRLVNFLPVEIKTYISMKYQILPSGYYYAIPISLKPHILIKYWYIGSDSPIERQSIDELIANILSNGGNADKMSNISTEQHVHTVH